MSADWMQLAISARGFLRTFPGISIEAGELAKLIVRKNGDVPEWTPENGAIKLSSAETLIVPGAMIVNGASSVGSAGRQYDRVKNICVGVSREQTATVVKFQASGVPGPSGTRYIVVRHRGAQVPSSVEALSASTSHRHDQLMGDRLLKVMEQGRVPRFGHMSLHQCMGGNPTKGLTYPEKGVMIETSPLIICRRGLHATDRKGVRQWAMGVSEIIEPVSVSGAIQWGDHKINAQVMEFGREPGGALDLKQLNLFPDARCGYDYLQSDQILGALTAVYMKHIDDSLPFNDGSATMNCREVIERWFTESMYIDGGLSLIARVRYGLRRHSASAETSRLMQVAMDIMRETAMNTGETRYARRLLMHIGADLGATEPTFDDAINAMDRIALKKINERKRAASRGL